MKLFSASACALVLASLVIVRGTAQSTTNACATDVTVAYDGDAGPVRVILARDGRGPLVRTIALGGPGGFKTVAENVRPMFTVASGLRRMTNQQLDPLAGLDVPITNAVMDKYKWEAFWDAPLNLPGADGAHNNTTPPQRGVLGQPGLPRTEAEVTRAAVSFTGGGCTVTNDGARIEVSFPGAHLGVFNGRLQYTFYKGTNLIRQELIATTTSPSVAYKYDAGLNGLPPAGLALSWHDVDAGPHTATIDRGVEAPPVIVRSTNRILTAALPGGAIAAFPPPHNFFWARETSYNLGYNWYQSSAASTAFGVRQSEGEAPPEVANRGTEDRAQNFALKSARPGTEQRMPVYFYIGSDPAKAASGAAAFTRGDQFKALPGYQVMAAHFHMGLVARERAAGGPGSKVPDLEVLKAAGVNIASPIDGGGGFVAALARGGDPALNGDDPKWLRWSRDLGVGPGTVPARAGGGRGTAAATPFAAQHDYYEAATRQSSSTFVVMPNMEMIRGDVTRELGGHTDIMMSRPVYWQQGKLPGEPFVADDPTYGRVYRVETAKEFMEMVRRENLALFMPHPRTKGSTGYPDAIKDSAAFLDPNYRGAGFRWGMGLDGSETRLCEYRCLPLFDDMNNWVVGKNTPPKYMQAISEFYQQAPGDDIYANNPVNYMKIGALPTPGDWTPIVNAFKSGDFFVTSGEVLITNYAVRGSGTSRVISADVEWTFPLDFVEVVWGNGRTTGRTMIKTTELPPFGTHHFEVPVNTAGQAWIRFAAWDSAGNGAFVQPVAIR